MNKQRDFYSKYYRKIKHGRGKVYPPPPLIFLLLLLIITLLIILLYPKAKQSASTLFSTLLPRPTVYSGT